MVGISQEENAIEIFISYRHNDEQLNVSSIRTSLAEEFGPEKIFFDLESTEERAGERLSPVIDEALNHTKVVLVFFGKNWQYDPASWGTHEIIRALELEEQGSIRQVIPIELEDVKLEDLNLPDELSALKEKVRLPVTAKHYSDDLDKLIRNIEKHVTKSGSLLSSTLIGQSTSSSLSPVSPTYFEHAKRFFEDYKSYFHSEIAAEDFSARKRVLVVRGKDDVVRKHAAFYLADNLLGQNEDIQSCYTVDLEHTIGGFFQAFISEIGELRNTIFLLQGLDFATAGSDRFAIPSIEFERINERLNELNNYVILVEMEEAYLEIDHQKVHLLASDLDPEYIKDTLLRNFEALVIDTNDELVAKLQKTISNKRMLDEYLSGLQNLFEDSQVKGSQEINERELLLLANQIASNQSTANDWFDRQLSANEMIYAVIFMLFSDLPERSIRMIYNRFVDYLLEKNPTSTLGLSKNNAIRPSGSLNVSQMQRNIGLYKVSEDDLDFFQDSRIADIETKINDYGIFGELVDFLFDYQEAVHSDLDSWQFRKLCGKAIATIQIKRSITNPLDRFFRDTLFVHQHQTIRDITAHALAELASLNDSHHQEIMQRIKGRVPKNPTEGDLILLQFFIRLLGIISNTGRAVDIISESPAIPERNAISVFHLLKLLATKVNQLKQEFYENKRATSLVELQRKYVVFWYIEQSLLEALQILFLSDADTFSKEIEQWLVDGKSTVREAGKDVCLRILRMYVLELIRFQEHINTFLRLIPLLIRFEERMLHFEIAKLLLSMAHASNDVQKLESALFLIIKDLLDESHSFRSDFIATWLEYQNEHINPFVLFFVNRLLGSNGLPPITDTGRTVVFVVDFRDAPTDGGRDKFITRFGMHAYLYLADYTNSSFFWAGDKHVFRSQSDWLAKLNAAPHRRQTSLLPIVRQMLLEQDTKATATFLIFSNAIPTDWEDAVHVFPEQRYVLFSASRETEAKEGLEVVDIGEYKHIREVVQLIEGIAIDLYAGEAKGTALNVQKKTLIDRLHQAMANYQPDGDDQAFFKLMATTAKLLADPRHSRAVLCSVIKSYEDKDESDSIRDVLLQTVLLLFCQLVHAWALDEQMLNEEIHPHFVYTLSLNDKKIFKAQVDLITWWVKNGMNYRYVAEVNYTQYQGDIVRAIGARLSAPDLEPLTASIDASGSEDHAEALKKIRFNLLYDHTIGALPKYEIAPDKTYRIILLDPAFGLAGQDSDKEDEAEGASALIHLLNELMGQVAPGTAVALFWLGHKHPLSINGTVVLEKSILGRKSVLRFTKSALPILRQFSPRQVGHILLISNHEIMDIEDWIDDYRLTKRSRLMTSDELIRPHQSKLFNNFRWSAPNVIQELVRYLFQGG